MMRIPKSRELPVLVLLVMRIPLVATVNNAALYPITRINILNASLLMLLLAIGQMFVMLTCSIDVSVGATAGVSAVIFGFALNAGLPLPPAMLAALITGLLCGMANGLGVAFVGIRSIIMTLVTLGVDRSLMRVLTGGSRIETIPQNIKSFAVTRHLSVPLMVWTMVVVVIVVAILLWKLKPARYFGAVGDKYDGAYLLRINVKMTRFWAFSLAGLFAGAAAVVYIGQVGFVPMQTSNGQELKAIAPVVLGGVSLMGGTGSIWSAVIGALFQTAVA